MQIEKKLIKLEDSFYSDVDNLAQPFNAVIIITDDPKQYTATYAYKGIGK